MNHKERAQIPTILLDKVNKVKRLGIKYHSEEMPFISPYFLLCKMQSQDIRQHKISDQIDYLEVIIVMIIYKLLKSKIQIISKLLFYIDAYGETVLNQVPDGFIVDILQIYPQFLALGWVSSVESDLRTISQLSEVLMFSEFKVYEILDSMKDPEKNGVKHAKIIQAIQNISLSIKDKNENLIYAILDKSNQSFNKIRGSLIEILNLMPDLDICKDLLKYFNSKSNNVSNAVKTLLCNLYKLDISFIKDNILRSYIYDIIAEIKDFAYENAEVFIQKGQQNLAATKIYNRINLCGAVVLTAVSLGIFITYLHNSKSFPMLDSRLEAYAGLASCYGLFLLSGEIANHGFMVFIINLIFGLLFWRYLDPFFPSFIMIPIILSMIFVMIILGFESFIIRKLHPDYYQDLYKEISRSQAKINTFQSLIQSIFDLAQTDSIIASVDKMHRFPAGLGDQNFKLALVNVVKDYKVDALNILLSIKSKTFIQLMLDKKFVFMVGNEGLIFAFFLMFLVFGQIVMLGVTLSIFIVTTVRKGISEISSLI